MDRLGRLSVQYIPWGSPQGTFLCAHTHHLYDIGIQMTMRKYPAHSDAFKIFLFFAGVCLIGTGGEWFPMLNLAGILMTGLSGLLSTSESEA